MKKIDYYAAPQPWKMPKWLGVTLGGIFASVAVGALALVVHLTRPAHAETQPALAETSVTAPAATPQVVTPPPVQSAEQVASVSHSRHTRTPARHAPKPTFTKAKSTAILARHDSREKRKQKDDLDRLLGL